jgi:hypothetical protein
MKRYSLILALSIVLGVNAIADCSSVEQRREALLKARTVQVDTGFPYYQNRSDESIASEIELNGYKGVYLFVFNENGVRPGLIKALQDRGMPVAGMFFASGVYASPDVKPADLERWKMKFTTNDLSQYTFYSYVHKDYCEHLKKMVVSALSKYPFDGFTFAEVMYPIFDGPTRPKVLYGDISEGFQKEFKKDTGNKDFPDFNNPQSPNYFLRNTKLYNDLVKYRIKTVNDFYSEVVNGKGGIREKCPGVLVASWSLAVSIPKAVERLAEWEGDDASLMIKAVKPDLHFLQTHAPDWTNPELKADYVKSYRPFLEQIRATDKNLKIGLQADIGSQDAMRKDPNWMRGFYKACGEEKISTTTCYELHIRWQVYESVPSLKKAAAQKDGSIKLYFDKRIASSNADLLKGRAIEDTKGNKYEITVAKVDGNILEIGVNKAITAGKEIIIPIGGICDDPSTRFIEKKDKPLNRVNTVPSGEVQKLILQ